jgi:hypothetical protein
MSAESDLQKKCNAELRRRGIRFLHLSHRAREGKGWPDLVFALNGHPVAVELKDARGKLSQDQVDTLDGMTANGWHCHVVREFADFLAVIAGRGVVQPEKTRWKFISLFDTRKAGAKVES